ncbi:hypothetical protein [Rosenbergiella nectarea]|uniref:hypothetical protein n=1 Tax=Rosenbergiella nectarea TaxID=988801 RepID=UPI001F4E89E2|nr:hypothetical protein [Rosenbergiella nectarea]
MFTLEKFNFYKKKYKHITNDDEIAYNKIKNYHYGKSCSPIIYSKNILFLGVESIIDVVIFHQLNPKSDIFIFGCSEIQEIELSQITDNLNFFNNLEELFEINTAFDSVKVTKEFCNVEENRLALYKIESNRLYGDFEVINTPPLDLYLNVRNRFNIFYLVDDNADITLSGYKQKKQQSDISIIISGGIINDRLKENIVLLRKQSKLDIDIILCPHNNNEILDHDFITKNNIILISELDSGYNTAWYKGFHHSNSEYIFFMYSEDCFSGDIFDELFLLSIITHSDITQSGYKIFENKKLDNREIITNGNEYGIVTPPKSLLKEPITPWGRLYNSTFLNNIGLDDENCFQELIFNFLTISSANTIASIPDKYYLKYSNSIKLETLQKIDLYKIIYDIVRPHASMEVMSTLLELEISAYHELGLTESNERKFHLTKYLDRLNLYYGDKYHLQDKLSCSNS